MNRQPTFEMRNSAAKKKKNLQLSTLKRDASASTKRSILRSVLPISFGRSKRRIQNEMECSTSTLGTYVSTSQKSLNAFDKEQELLQNGPAGELHSSSTIINESSPSNYMTMIDEYSISCHVQDISQQEFIPRIQEYDSCFQNHPSCTCTCDCHSYVAPKHHPSPTSVVTYIQTPAFENNHQEHFDWTTFGTGTSAYPLTAFPYASSADNTWMYELPPCRDSLPTSTLENYETTKQKTSAEDQTITAAKKEAFNASKKYYGSNTIFSHLYKQQGY